MMSVNVTPDEWEMVSAYLDDQLPAAEKLIIEQQLGLRPELQSAYHELRRLKFAFKSLPPKKAPRNYTLSPKEKKEKTSIFQMLVPAFGFSSAVAAILLAITIFFQITPSGSMVSQAPEPAMMAAEQESGQSKTAPETQPQIITWGSPGGVGFGGGGAGAAVRHMASVEEHRLPRLNSKLWMMQQKLRGARTSLQNPFQLANRP